MDEMLRRLEIKIKELINHQNSLNHANRAVVLEKIALLENQQKAMHQVEALIAKLREATL